MSHDSRAFPVLLSNKVGYLTISVPLQQLPKRVRQLWSRHFGVEGRGEDGSSVHPCITACTAGVALRYDVWGKRCQQLVRDLSVCRGLVRVACVVRLLLTLLLMKGLRVGDLLMVGRL